MVGTLGAEQRECRQSFVKNVSKYELVWQGLQSSMKASFGIGQMCSS